MFDCEQNSECFDCGIGASVCVRQINDINGIRGVTVEASADIR